MTNKYRALAIAGIPGTPCGTARLLVEADGRVSRLTSRGPAGKAVSLDEFHALARQGSATRFPGEKIIEVEQDWYALYLRKELADVMGGLTMALGFPRQADGNKPFELAPEDSAEMNKKGWVIVLGSDKSLWDLRKEWCDFLLKSNQESNRNYFATQNADLLNTIEKHARFGLYCAKPGVTPEAHIKFARELALVMMRRCDQDTCYRVYKYQIKPFFPGLSWDDFVNQVTKLQDAYHVRFKDFQLKPQQLVGEEEATAVMPRKSRALELIGSR